MVGALEIPERGAHKAGDSVGGLAGGYCQGYFGLIDDPAGLFVTTPGKMLDPGSWAGQDAACGRLFFPAPRPGRGIGY
ncbi:MAG: hypothetical protein ACRDPF_37015, partial [Streptosporangiaceae bacterium]